MHLSDIVRRNRTPKGDGNSSLTVSAVIWKSVRRNRTPKGDGNISGWTRGNLDIVRRNRTPKGDGNLYSADYNDWEARQLEGIEPRKGTETVQNHRLPPCTLVRRNRTPKGDGNFFL